MEVSKGNQPGGTVLLDQVVSLTGLPEKEVQAELCQIIEEAGMSSSSLTLDQLRAAMVAYLESLQAEFLDQPDEPAPAGAKEKLTLITE